MGPKKPHGPHDKQNNNNKSRKYGTGQGPIRGAVQATLVRAAPMRGWFPRHPRPQSGGRQRATTQAKRAHPARQLPVPAPATRCIEQSRCDAQVAGEGVGNRRTRPGGRDEGDVAPQEGSRALATRACRWASHCRKVGAKLCMEQITWIFMRVKQFDRIPQEEGVFILLLSLLLHTRLTKTMVPPSLRHYLVVLAWP